MPIDREGLSYRDFPALAAYVDRIKAECRNFFRYMIVEHKANGYYSEKVYISISPDGQVKVTDENYKPTKEEAKAIENELVRRYAELPNSVCANSALMDDLRSICGYPGEHTLYEFYDRSVEGHNNIIMVQQRVEPAGGKKFFLNWSYWSDGIWRKMEPDRPLPFWKPKEVDPGAPIMVHEGGKTAKMLNELKKMPAKLAQHPWGEVIKCYEHWGMIGGALVPHRSDYKELKDEKRSQLVYVCDNDSAGKRVLQRFSEFYGGALTGVMFDERFPPTWDMGDAFPDHFFKEGRYIGPQFEEFVTFATFATRKIPNETGKGAPVAVITDNFAAEWYHCVSPEVFIHRQWPSLVLTLNEFNNHVRPFSHVDDTARHIKKEKACKSALLSYQPGLPSGIYADVDGAYINTHVGSRIKEPKHPHDYAPWTRFMEHLVPDEKDRHELLRWCATLIARPDIKMLYGVLLISETQGIGKGTLGERVLAPLVGLQNCSFPSETEIVDGNYNYWAAHKRLAVVHEIYAGHSAKAYNKLKSIITDKQLTVMKKYQANYIIENWVHVLACSNSTRALQLSMDDRRWLVPKLTEIKKPSSYWEEFNGWLLDGGLEAVWWWAKQFVEKYGPVLRGEAAPWTAAKKEVVEDGYSPGMELIGNLLDMVKDKIADDKFRDRLVKANMLKDDRLVIVDKDLVEYIKFKLYDGRTGERLEKPATLRKVAKGRGWHVSNDRVWGWTWGPERRGGRVIALDSNDAVEIPSDITPLDLKIVEAL